MLSAISTHFQFERNSSQFIGETAQAAWRCKNDCFATRFQEFGRGAQTR